MAAKYTRFFCVKLILILFASAAATLLAFLFSLTLPENTDASFRAVLTGAVPSLMFFAFIYSFESKIKTPDGTALTPAYFLKFTLKETSVYFVFELLPYTVTALCGLPENGFLRTVLIPHVSPVPLGVPLPLSYVIFVLIYAALSFAAHLIRSKKPQTAAAPPLTGGDDAAQSDVPGMPNVQAEDGEETEKAEEADGEN